MAENSYLVEEVEFDNGEGNKLKGDLFMPTRASGKVPAIVTIGPILFVKEQAPTQYATRLAGEGYAILAFDMTTHGESKGEPRRHESPARKVEDLHAAVEYLTSRPDIDAERIGILGICQGVNHALRAASENDRVKTVATVAGQYIEPETMLGFFQSQENWDARVERGRAAREKFDKTGEADYLPIVDPERKDVALPARPIWQWYNAWEVRDTNWENRYAVLSDAEIWTVDVRTALAELRQPWLMVHAEKATSPDSAHRAFAAPNNNKIEKRQVWLEHRNIVHQTRFYDDPIVIDLAIAELKPWFVKRLR